LPLPEFSDQALLGGAEGSSAIRENSSSNNSSNVAGKDARPRNLYMPATLFGKQFPFFGDHTY